MEVALFRGTPVQNNLEVQAWNILFPHPPRPSIYDFWRTSHEHHPIHPSPPFAPKAINWSIALQRPAHHRRPLRTPHPFVSASPITLIFGWA